MKNKFFIDRVKAIDWTIYSEPEYVDSTKMDYNPNEIVNTLTCLYNFDENRISSIGLESELRFAIGNDHRGTFYPAALEAIDFIIEIEKNSKNELARKCALAVLNDLHYFQLEMPMNEKDLYNSIENQIKEKLKPYSDEHIEKYWD